jgi:error-prone DNA polymerase
MVLWQLGIAATAEAVGGGEGHTRDRSAREATQLALPLELSAAPRLRQLGRWQRLIADYSTSGVTLGEHAIAILRERLTVPMLATSAQLARLPSGSRVTVAGLVIARQKPGTANGTMFLLFEDELGTINLIVPKVVYERHRHLARAEPLLLASGRLERTQQSAGVDEQGEEIRPVINVLVRELGALERHLTDGSADKVVEIGSSMRAAAPPVQSFAMGRRR